MKLDDALWVYRIAFKTPIGLTPYQLIYGKSFHLPVELEHRAYWATRALNFDFDVVDHVAPCTYFTKQALVRGEVVDASFHFIPAHAALKKGF